MLCCVLPLLLRISQYNITISTPHDDLHRCSYHPGTQVHGCTLQGESLRKCCRRSGNGGTLKSKSTHCTTNQCTPTPHHSSTAAQQHSSTAAEYTKCATRPREARLLSRAGCVVRVSSPFIQLVLLTRTTLHRRHPRSNTTTASLYSAKQCGWWWYRLTYEVDTEPYAVSRDASISTLAADVGVAVESHTSHTLWDVDRYVHTRVCHAASDS